MEYKTTTDQLVDMLRLVPTNGSTRDYQGRIVKSLENFGATNLQTNVTAWYRSKYGLERRGRIDVAGDLDGQAVFIECDRRSPRQSSVRKLGTRPPNSIRLILCREAAPERRVYHVVSPPSPCN